MATLDSLMLCYPERLTVHLNVTPTHIQITANLSTVSYMTPDALQEALERLNATMQNPVSTYIGGIPGQQLVIISQLYQNVVFITAILT